MLKYKSNESQNSSHFFITTEAESLHLLNFSKTDPEITYFHNDFLQENALEMTIVRATEYRESFSKGLADTIKNIFDDILYRKDNCVIYLTVDVGTGKHTLIDSFIKSDKNKSFFGVNIILEETTAFYFFFNSDKTNSIQRLKDISEFFKEEYHIDLTIVI